jgi:hypothetical protein
VAPSGHVRSSLVRLGGAIDCPVCRRAANPSRGSATEDEGRERRACLPPGQLLTRTDRDLLNAATGRITGSRTVRGKLGTASRNAPTETDLRQI